MAAMRDRRKDFISTMIKVTIRTIEEDLNHITIKVEEGIIFEVHNNKGMIITIITMILIILQKEIIKMMSPIMMKTEILLQEDKVKIIMIITDLVHHHNTTEMGHLKIKVEDLLIP